MESSQQQQAVVAAMEAQEPDAVKVAQLCERCPKSDVFAQHAKGIALLQQGKHVLARPVLAAIDSLDKPAAGVNPIAVRFAHAYSVYKTGDLKDAIQLVEAAFAHGKFGARASTDSALLNLHAQALYNSEDYPKAAEVFEKILSEGRYRDEQERAELLTNLSAAYSQFDYAKCKKTAKRAAADGGGTGTFDSVFNAATGAIQKKDYAAAQTQLTEAMRLCLEENEWDSSADVVALSKTCAAPDCDKATIRIVKEVSPVLVQQAFVHYALGDEQAAAKILEPLVALEERLSVATYAAVCVNWAAIQRHRDFMNTFKHLKHVQQPAVEVKLTSHQRLYVKYNTVLLLLGMGGRLHECRRLVDAMIREVPESDLGPLALIAVLSHSDSKRAGTSRAEEQFKSFVQQRGGEDSPFASFTLAQLALERGNVAAAMDRVKSAGALLRSHPAAIATVAHTLATRVGDADAAVSLLKDLEGEFAGSDLEQQFCAFAADFYSVHNRDALASEQYEKLLTKFGKAASDSDRQRWVAGLVSSAAHTKPALAAKFAAQLPDSSAVFADASAATAGPSPSSMAEVGLRRPTAGAEGQVKIKPARKRPMRRPPVVPQGATGPAAMEPERWVPMKQRTYIRDLPARRQRELRRRRAMEQEEKRRQHERKKREAAAAAAASA